MGKILIKETIKKYGYNPNDLRPSSEKLVIWQCSKCKIKKPKKYRYAKKNNLCLICSNKINANTNTDIKIEKLIKWYKNNKHPLKDTVRPFHVIEAIRLSKLGSHISEETKEKLSKRNSGEGNPMFGKKHTEETLKKMRLTAKKNAKRGKDCNFYGKCYHGKGEYYICKDNTKIWMRSSWEIKFARYLDDENIKWTFEKTAFPIIYNNKNGTYRPDFYIIDKDLYIEIKGWWRDDAKIKYNAFKQQYKNMNIEVYDKDKLKKLKIL